MNITGAALDRVGQHQVDELNDRGLIGSLLKLLELEFMLFGLHLDVAGFAEIAHRLHYVFEVFFLFSRAVSLIDALDDGAFRSHHRLDIEAGHELDVVHGEDVGGIDHGDGEGGAHAAQRKNLVALRGFKRNQLDDGGVDFKIRKIDGGHAVLAREEVGDILVGEEPQLHESRRKADMRLLLKLGRLFQLLWGDDLFFYEKVAQPLRHISPVSRERGGCETADFRGDSTDVARTDINCQPNGYSEKVTSVPVLRAETHVSIGQGGCEVGNPKNIAIPAPTRSCSSV